MTTHKPLTDVSLPAHTHTESAEDTTALHLRDIAALVALSIGMFTLVTAEQLPVGVLTVQSEDLGVSIGTAGLAVTVPGLLGAVMALLTPILVRSMDRRLVIALGLLAIVVSTWWSAIAQDFTSLLLARALTGVAIGLYWPILPVVALRQVHAARSATALSIVYAGNAGALVLGVPLVAWLGASFSWRVSYAVVGAIAAAMLVAVLLLVRPVTMKERVTLSAMTSAIGTPVVRWAALMTLLVVVGHYGAYSFVTPTLIERAGVTLAQVSGYLLAFGVLGILGNFAVAPLLKGRPSRVIALVAGGITVALLGVFFVMSSAVSAWFILPVWGLFAGAISVSVQAYVSRAGADAGVEEQATAVNSAIFTGAIAVGAAYGGALYEGGGSSLLVLGTAAITFLGLMAALGAGRRADDPGKRAA